MSQISAIPGNMRCRASITNRLLQMVGLKWREPRPCRGQAEEFLLPGSTGAVIGLCSPCTIIKLSDRCCYSEESLRDDSIKKEVMVMGIVICYFAELGHWQERTHWRELLRLHWWARYPHLSLRGPHLPHQVRPSQELRPAVLRVDPLRAQGRR